MQDEPQLLLIDCDPGVDDAAALMVAGADPRVQIVGITTVRGNVSVEQATHNALGVLALIGRDDIPLAVGAPTGLLSITPEDPGIHGPNGIGGVELTKALMPLTERHAVEFLAGVLAAAERPVTVGAIGPLTNLALLSVIRPDLLDKIDRIVMMGTSSGPGNITSYAEFNTFADPEAAQHVLCHTGLDILAVELEATRRATVDRATSAALRGASKAGRALAAMIDGYGDGLPEARPIHDLLAIAAVLDPALVETRPARVEVVTGRGERRGQSLYVTEGLVDAAPNVHVVVDLDLEGVRSLLLERVGSL